jgi:hypothetical protein
MRWRHLTLVTVVLALVAGLAVVAPAAPAATPGRVLVLSLPRVQWQDVLDVRPPNLLGLLERSAVASLSVRAIGPTTGLAEGYATIGAGNRARFSCDLGGRAYQSDELLGGQPAAEVVRAGGTDPGDAAVLQVEAAEAARVNDQLAYGAETGALGDALGSGSTSGAVIGNADVAVPSDAALVPHREAAAAVMDRAGRVPGGVVDRSITVTDPAAPGGLRLEPAATVDAFRSAWERHDVVLLEVSDLERAELASRGGCPAAGDRLPVPLLGRVDRLAALRAADPLVGEVLAEVDLTRDTVLVVAPAAPGDLPRLTVFALAGPDVEPGLARSATTRRAGNVTLPDIGVTVLERLGLAVPDTMNGTAITSAGGGPVDAGDLEALADANEVATMRDRAVGPLSVAYIVLQVIGYALAVLALERRHRLLWFAAIGIALTTLAVPLVAFLSGLVRYDSLGVGSYVLGVLGVAGAVAVAVLPLWRFHLFLPAVALVAANWLLQVVDIVTGGHLQINTVFGYSPTVAGRFQGFGNLSFSLLAIGAIVTATALWGWRRDDPAPARDRWLGVAALLLGVTLVVDGSPNMGSDVGGVLAAFPAFVVVLALLGGWRLGWRRGALIGVATVVVLGVFAAFDLSRPESQRTHLGRFVQRLVDGDAGVILRRKLNANLSILTSSVWTLLIPVGFAFLAFLVVRRHGFLRDLQTTVPGVRACLWGALVLGALGFALNDSGVAIPAMMFGILLPWIAFLTLRTRAGHLSASPAGPPPTGGPA